MSGTRNSRRIRIIARHFLATVTTPKRLSSLEAISKTSWWLMVGAMVLLGNSSNLTAVESLRPRAAVIKPAQTVVNPVIHQTDRVAVKFRDGQTIRLRNGVPTDVSSGVLLQAQAAISLPSMVAGGTWERMHLLSEDQLKQLRLTAERNLGREIADLNLEFILVLPAGADAGQVLDALNTLEIVEVALPIPRPMAAPVPPNYQSNQGYLNAATSGVNANCMWQLPGGTGGNSAIADIEYSWNLSHQDLGAATLLGPTPVDPYSDDNHGTAVLGEIGALNNGWGVTGIAYGSIMYVVAANTSSGYNISSAITSALGTLNAGDVILIEQQIAGPNYTGSPPGTQFGLVPVEWNQSYYNSIVTAVGNGVVVVEAAGNGSQDLDSSAYSTGNGGHYPFLPLNDSGAIIVGAGASPGGSTTDRSRLSFSNYGSTVDLQGWGENVYTTGYGGLYSAQGKNLYYTGTFSGTSSASPIVASASVLLQSAYRAATGNYLTPAQVRSNLIATGSAQQAGTYPTSQNIGPRPDAARALCNALPAIDANTNLVPDLCENLAGIQACCFSSGGCTDTTPTNCTNNGGTPQGTGTACATTQCPLPQPNEACCYSNGSCQDIPAATCTTNGGTPKGPGTTCATTQCIVTEACCMPGPAAACVDLPVAQCQMNGGLPQGPGTFCATTQCQPMVPKFDQPPTMNHEDLASDIDLMDLNPNVVLADDFQSDGRPITVVRWWGSYLDPRYLPLSYGGYPSPTQIDGWLISFHEPLTAGSGTLQPVLGLYFADAANVTIQSTNVIACDGHQVFMYTAEIKRCCLVYARPDSRSNWMPARAEAFEEEHCFVYDLDIQAVVGMKYQRNPQNGACIQMPSQNTAMADFWGWHATDNEMGFRQALKSITTPAPAGSGLAWMYGPWNNVAPICGTAPINMSFQLLTSSIQVPPPCTEACCFMSGPCQDLIPTNCQMMGGIPQGAGTKCATTICEISYPKFSQPPQDGYADIHSNIDLQLLAPNVVIAEDFQSDGRPITWVQWWGSYIDPRYLPPQAGGTFSSPNQIDGWLISFHEHLALTNPPLPPQPPLALYFVNTADVAIQSTPTLACDGHVVYGHAAKISRACLLYAKTDSRSGALPGLPDAFHEEHCFWYDLDIQAVAGKKYTSMQPGTCVETVTQNSFQGLNVWGWHSTGVENGWRSALMTQTQPAPVGMPWLYGPWGSAPPFCSPPPANMAFALLTNDTIVPPPCCRCLGDLTGDGLIDGLDIAGFVGCLLGTPPPGVNCLCADMDGLNGPDINDVTLFVNHLLASPACPYP